MRPLTVPDLFEPIIGYREWNVFGDSPRLRSLVRSSTKWPADEALAAEGQLEEGGIYAYKTSTDLLGFGGVHGEVWLWGRVEENERGFRAEYAYPKRLWAALRHVPGLPRVSRAQVKAVGEFYSVPVVLYSGEERLPWRLGSIVARFTSSRSTPPSPPRWSTHPPYTARTPRNPWL